MTAVKDRSHPGVRLAPVGGGQMKLSAEAEPSGTDACAAYLRVIFQELRLGFLDHAEMMNETPCIHIVRFGLDVISMG
jgi:hypothetical protein